MRNQRWNLAAVATGLLAVALAALPALPVWAGGGADHNADFTGVIESLPGDGGLVGTWTVGGTTVVVSTMTEIDTRHGAVAVGATVEVKGMLLDGGTVAASHIKVEEVGPIEPPQDQPVDFKGTIEALPGGLDLLGDWMVDGVTVHVSATTVIDQEHGAPAVGVTVEVEGTRATDGSVDATKIEVKSVTPPPPGPCPEDIIFLKLKPTTDAPTGAEGKAIARTFNLPNGTVRDDLKVEVEHLSPRSLFDVFVDDVHAATITTNEDGEGHIFLSSAAIPGADPLPAELRPITSAQRIDVIDASTKVELTGNFADGRRVNCQQPLEEFEAIAVLRDATGTVAGLAEARIHEQKQELRVRAFDLAPSASFDLVVDGTDLGTFASDDHGRLRVEFSTEPASDKLPLPGALQPVSVLMHVDLKQGDAVVAGGDFGATDSSASSHRTGSLRRRLGHH